MVGQPLIPPRNVNWSASGRWVHIAKIGFEKYFQRKMRTGESEPFYEASALGMLGIDKLTSARADEVVAYQPDKARDLVASLSAMPGFVFEAHSTDYQPAAALDALVRDGFAILKVGPWLTFALREALYGLDAIAETLSPAAPEERLTAIMEALMLEAPEHWRAHYRGRADETRLQRHFSFSDRIRYYWAHPRAQAAVERLFARLGERIIPTPLVGQYLGALQPAVADGALVARPRDLAIAAVQRVLTVYDNACRGA